jgi:Fic family protein
MQWNWQQSEWPNFTWNTASIKALEDRFLYESGLFFGAYQNMQDEDKTQLRIQLISEEALMTAEIEGEYLNRASLQASIRRQFGLELGGIKIPPAEQGLAEMMISVYQTFDAPLTAATLFQWHDSLMQGRHDIEAIGQYRTHSDPMQIVSGYLHKPTVHYEAPPSERMQTEMQQFIKWFNDSAPASQGNIAILTRAGVAHLYFESIHPFEDGNGRLGRAISEKALAQGLGQPSLTALSQTIQAHKKGYYEALQKGSQQLDVTPWLLWFADIVLKSRQTTQDWITFLISKAHLYNRVQHQLNPRQEKVLRRMFQEGPQGFQGGLSADNYSKITGAPHATVTRDLQDLVAIGVLNRQGERRYTRYYLNLS